jgi:hypothetical protein
MLHTRPDVKAGPIDRSRSPEKVGVDIGSGDRRGSSLGFAEGSWAAFSVGSCASSSVECRGWRFVEPHN